MMATCNGDLGMRLGCLWERRLPGQRRAGAVSSAIPRARAGGGPADHPRQLTTCGLRRWQRKSGAAARGTGDEPRKRKTVSKLPARLLALLALAIAVEGCKKPRPDDVLYSREDYAATCSVGDGSGPTPNFCGCWRWFVKTGT